MSNLILERVLAYHSRIDRCWKVCLFEGILLYFWKEDVLSIDEDVILWDMLVIFLYVHHCSKDWGQNLLHLFDQKYVAN